MANRGGRGRGRFGGGGGHIYCKQEEFILYPELTLRTPPKVFSDDTKNLVKWKSKFESYWRSSPYYLGDGKSKTDPFENADPERYSDKEKPKNKQSLREFLQPTAAHFPGELLEDSKEGPRKKRKKVQWVTETDFKKFNVFEKLEQKQENEGENEKKEGAEDEDEDDAGSEDGGMYSDDGDYEQNIDFDDDEDDHNMSDGGDDEATL